MIYMSKREKLIQKIITGRSNITPTEAKKLLEILGYVADGPSGGSSHLTFRKQGKPSVTIVLTQNPLKPYMVVKLQIALKNEGY